ncbi:multifunctional CCA protein, partial [Striga asiatica]
MSLGSALCTWSSTGLTEAGLPLAKQTYKETNPTSTQDICSLSLIWAKDPLLVSRASSNLRWPFLLGTLSPLLFCIAPEVLARMLKSSMVSGRLSPFVAPRGTRGNCSRIRSILLHYGEASGQ